jgi:hypothetical protein
MHHASEASFRTLINYFLVVLLYPQPQLRAITRLDGHHISNLTPNNPLKHCPEPAVRVRPSTPTRHVLTPPRLDLTFRHFTVLKPGGTITRHHQDGQLPSDSIPNDLLFTREHPTRSKRSHSLVPDPPDKPARNSCATHIQRMPTRELLRNTWIPVHDHTHGNGITGPTAAPERASRTWPLALTEGEEPDLNSEPTQTQCA